jgi:hypothetical protein
VSDHPRSLPPPITPCLQEAIDRVDQELAYHDRRMTKRVRKLRNEPPPAFEDEPNTGVLVPAARSRVTPRSSRSSLR